MDRPEFPQALQDELARLARREAPALLEQARRAAVAEVESRLKDFLVKALLAEAGGRWSARAEETPLAPPPPHPQRQPERQGQPQPQPPPDAQPQPHPHRPPTDEQAWYVYGVVAAEAVSELPAIEGVEPGSRVVSVTEAGLRALTSRVPASEFQEERLRERLNELEWVERTARGHQRVLDSLLPSATVIPLRMCTVLRSEDRVREMLRRERPLLEQALLELDGCLEWGVKVFAVPEPARPTPEVAADPADADRGTLYMTRRRVERDRREAAEQRAIEAAEELHLRLAATAGDSRRLPLQPHEATGHAGAMVLNGVYLIPRDATRDFHDLVERERERWGGTGGRVALELALTGPWPAYNFLPGMLGVAT